MKKIIAVLMLVSVLGLTSCFDKKDNTNNTNTKSEVNSWKTIDTNSWKTTTETNSWKTEKTTNSWTESKTNTGSVNKDESHSWEKDMTIDTKKTDKTKDDKSIFVDEKLLKPFGQDVSYYAGENSNIVYIKGVEEWLGLAFVTRVKENK